MHHNALFGKSKDLKIKFCLFVKKMPVIKIHLVGFYDSIGTYMRIWILLCSNQELPHVLDVACFVYFRYVLFYVIENSLLHITKNISTIEQEFMVYTLLFEITHDTTYFNFLIIK